MSQPIEKLTFVMLTGKNYHLWVRQATFRLIGRDKLELVNGERPAPIIKKKLESQQKRRRKLLENGEEITTRCAAG
jgi:gag-polypeptide of LTR copia-type